MRLALMAVSLVSGSALAWGPVLSGGALATFTKPDGRSALYLGPTLGVGIEFGERLNHELGVEGLQLPRFDRPGVATAVLGRYTLTFDFLGKRGFTPFVGAGVGVGRFFVVDTTERVSGWALAASVLAGVRYTFSFGLSLKATVVGSYYGATLFSVAPSAGVGWQF